MRTTQLSFLVFLVFLVLAASLSCRSGDKMTVKITAKEVERKDETEHTLTFGFEYLFAQLQKKAREMEPQLADANRLNPPPTDGTRSLTKPEPPVKAQLVSCAWGQVRPANMRATRGSELLTVLRKMRRTALEAKELVKKIEELPPGSIPAKFAEDLALLKKAGEKDELFGGFVVVEYPGSDKATAIPSGEVPVKKLASSKPALNVLALKPGRR